LVEALFGCEDVSEARCWSLTPPVHDDVKASAAAPAKFERQDLKTHVCSRHYIHVHVPKMSSNNITLKSYVQSIRAQ
jgi:hypothetical protein